jgi:hypothetical protein
VLHTMVRGACPRIGLLCVHRRGCIGAAAGGGDTTRAGPTPHRFDDPFRFAGTRGGHVVHPADVGLEPDSHGGHARRKGRHLRVDDC